MIKINIKIQFALLVICLFFLGIGINEIFVEGIKSGIDFIKQISPLIPFFASGFIFLNNIYLKKTDKDKKQN
jgi:hypothetical protein